MRLALEQWFRNNNGEEVGRARYSAAMYRHILKLYFYTSNERNHERATLTKKKIRGLLTIIARKTDLISNEKFDPLYGKKRKLIMAIHIYIYKSYGDLKEYCHSVNVKR